MISVEKNKDGTTTLVLEAKPDQGWSRRTEVLTPEEARALANMLLSTCGDGYQRTMNQEKRS